MPGKNSTVYQPRKEKKGPISPFARWLIHYAAEHGLSLPEMATQAGLSRRHIYFFIDGPKRKPDLVTVLKLSKYTGRPAEEIARLSGISHRDTSMDDPRLRELVDIYRRLPESMKSFLIANARLLADSAKATQKYYSADARK